MNNPVPAVRLACSAVFLFYALTSDLCAQVLDVSSQAELNQLLFRLLEQSHEVQRRIADVQSSYFKSSEIYIDNYPEKIPFLSGIVFPPHSDTGIIYARWLQGDWIIRKKDKFQSINRKIELGKVRNYPIKGIEEYLINPYKKYNTLPYVENNFYMLPFHEENLSKYTFEIYSKEKGVFNVFYKLNFKPKNEFGSFVSGTALIDSASAQIVFLHLNIYAQNKLNLADSLTIAVKFTEHNKFYLPEKYQYIYYYSIRGYSGRHELFVSIRYGEAEESNPSIRDIKIKMQNPGIFSYHELDQNTLQLYTEDSVYEYRRSKGLVADSILSYAVRNPFRTVVLSGLKYPAFNANGLMNFAPLWTGFGFNAVESFYLRLRMKISLNNPQNFTHELDLRSSLAENTLRWKQTFTWEYLHRLNGKGEVSFGNYIFQINENDPVLPVINSFYSLFLNQNFASYYQKSFVKGTFSISAGAFDFRLITEYSDRNPLFNNLERSPLFRTGKYLANNPDRPPVIDASGFVKHSGLTLDLDLSYHFGRKYFLKDQRKIPLGSEMPVLFANYRKGIQSPVSQTDFDQVIIGIQVKRKIPGYGISTLDLQYGNFLNNRRVEFVDFKHFNGIQTLFLQQTSDRWSDIRQFRTLRYYEFSTNRYFVELHYIHNFGGALLNNFRLYSRLNIHTTAGLNLLITDQEKIYIEPFLGLENLFKVFKVQIAYGVDYTQINRLTLRIGFNFNPGLYQKYRRI